MKILWEIIKLVTVLVFAAFILMLVGCASNLTPDEIEYRDAERAEQWRLCEMVYKANGVPTVHMGHSHDRRYERLHSQKEAIRSDLLHNDCRRILKQTGLWEY